MLVWTEVSSSVLYQDRVARYDPVADSWVLGTETGEPPERMKPYVTWTGSEMIIWGGHSTVTTNTGGLYDPSTDSWRTIETTGAPAARTDHSGVWTGSEMIIWGGYSTLGDGSSRVDSGGIYDPASNTWISTSVTDAPAARYGHGAVWTGRVMIVWGGMASSTTRQSDGGIYDPVCDKWLPMTDPPTAFDGRDAPHMIWTGSEAIIWSGWTGSSIPSDGAAYTP